MMRGPAALRLRGRDGPVRAELRRPAGTPAAVLVFVGDAHGELACRVLGDALGAVTLSTAPDDAGAAIDWTAAHAAELGAEPGSLIVAGLHDGADAAIRLAAGARERGWPVIARQLLIHPCLDEPAQALPGVAPATIVSAGAAGRDYAARLRAAGASVTLLERPDPFTGPQPDRAAAERLLAELAAVG
jgi:alpha/beta hydrolase fold